MSDGGASTAALWKAMWWALESERNGHDVGLGLQRPPHRLPQRRRRGAAVAHHLADQQLVEPRGDARDRARAVRSVPVAVAVAIAGEVALRDRNVCERRVGRVDAGVEQRDARTPAPEKGLSGAPTASMPHDGSRPAGRMPSPTARGRTSFMGSTGATSASGARRASATSEGEIDATVGSDATSTALVVEPPGALLALPVGCTRRMV